MAKIKNKNIYPIDQLIKGDEYLIGTDSDGKTVTFPITSLQAFIENGGVLTTDPDGGGGVSVLSGKLHTWLKYGDDNIGTNMSDSPNGKLI